MSRQIILKQTNESQYILIKITREECEEIQALMRLEATESEKYPFISEIEGCAHISKVTESQLSAYIPIYNKWRVRNEDFPLRAAYVNEFQCYASRGRDAKKFSSPILIHEDRIAAFRCACSCIGAEYFYIEKRKILIKGELFFIDQSTYQNNVNIQHITINGTNNNNDSAIRPEDTSI